MLSYSTSIISNVLMIVLQGIKIYSMRKMRLIWFLNELKAKTFIEFSPNVLCMSYHFQHFKSLKLTKNQKCWKATSSDKIYIWHSRREFRHETQTVVLGFVGLLFCFWFCFVFFLSLRWYYQCIRIGRRYPFRQTGKSWNFQPKNFRISILHHNTPHFIIKIVWGQTIENKPFSFPQIAICVLFLSFICNSERRFKQSLSRSQHPRLMPQSLNLTAFALSPSFEVFCFAQTFTTAEFKAGIPKSKSQTSTLILWLWS